MARRSKLEDMAIGFLLIVGVAVAAVVKFFETLGFVIPIVVIASGLIFFFWNKNAKEKKRRLSLTEKYNDEKVVNRIMNQMMWVGQTDGQLLDSLGAPEDVDQKVLKTKKKEVWKYGHKGGNRYKYRITLDNDEVVGWDEKA